MLKVKMPFAINVAAASKKVKTSSSNYTKRSRLISGIAVVIDKELWCKVDLKNDEVYPDFAVFKITKESLDNKGKKVLYHRENGKLWIYLRNEEEANFAPQVDSVWSPVLKDIFVTGYLVKNKITNRLEFAIKNTHGSNGKLMDYKPIDPTLPLYPVKENKDNGTSKSE